MTLAREWHYPYGLTMGEWFALTTWQKFRIFLWRLRYMQGQHCIFIGDRARAEFLGKSLKGHEHQCRCSKVKGLGCGFCWCRCTPDGTLAQGYNDLVTYTRRGTDQ